MNKNADMKLVALLLLLSLASFGQPSDPIKGDNIIELTSDIADTLLYSNIGRILLEDGYTFKSDKEFFTFKTDERGLPKWSSFRYTVNIGVYKGKIKLSGILRNTVNFNFGGASIADAGTPIEYRKGSADMRGPAFRLLDELAHKLAEPLGVTIITYRKQ